jgi:dihydropteroate synthase
LWEMVPGNDAFVPRAWAHRRGVLSLEQPRIMAIVNVTPDSFFDGGRLLLEGREQPDVDLVMRTCEQFASEGAHVIDVGGESTRPGARPVEPERELARIGPVVERLAGSSFALPISVDTRHAAVARQAIEAGADIINDVSGLADPDMAAVVADGGVGLVIGHLRGEPSTMQQAVHFDDVLAEVGDELLAAVERAVARGVERSRIVVDPGIGFGKSAEHSAALVAASARLARVTRCPVAIGASRKSFLRTLTGANESDRLAGSLAAALAATRHGASIVRVHDVGQTVEALAVTAAIESAYGRHDRGAA